VGSDEAIEMIKSEEINPHCEDFSVRIFNSESVRRHKSQDGSEIPHGDEIN
jgi:hypothetical protein